MKKFLSLFFLLITSLAFSQVDIKTNQIGPYVTLVRNATWGTVGVGNSDNSYIYTPQSSAAITCVYLANNNPTSAHAFTIAFLTTGDPKILGYQSQTTAIRNKWKTLSTTNATVNAGLVSVFGFSSLAAASAQILISGSSTQAGSPDTMDLYIVESNTNIDCSTSSIPIAGTVTISNILNIPSCNLSAVQSVASGATATLVAAPPAGQFIHVCAIIVSGDVTTNGLTVDFANGSAGTCTAPGTIKWQVSPHTGGSPMPNGAGIGQLFQTTVAAQPLCETAGAMGATQFVSVSYMVGP